MSELHGFTAVQISHKQQQDTKGDEGFQTLDYRLTSIFSAAGLGCLLVG